MTTAAKVIAFENVLPEDALSAAARRCENYLGLCSLKLDFSSSLHVIVLSELWSLRFLKPRMS